MAGFEVTLYGRFCVTPEANLYQIVPIGRLGKRIQQPHSLEVWNEIITTDVLQKCVYRWLND